MKKLFSILLYLLSSLTLTAQLTIHISQTPSNTPLISELFLAGNINNWNAGDQNYIFEKTNDQVYELVLDIAAGDLEFKITRGSWTSVEGNASGEYRPNRNYTYSGQPDTLTIEVLSWEDLSSSSGNSTASDNVSILSENFELNTIGRTRRIWLYLPPDYYQSNKSYPVLYMHDGQNLFDNQTSFSGEWYVDETLNELFAQGDPGIIVVGIDNGGAERINEYTPWPNAQYGGGNGANYIASIINDLKPFIDSNYRTLSSAEYTGIMGSSLGGLVSLYGIISNQETFGKAGIFSPSYWFSRECFQFVLDTGKKSKLRIYTIGGENESSTMASNIHQMDSVFNLINLDQTEYLSTIHPDGQHNEAYWAREFGAAYLWLFKNQTATSVSSLSSQFSFSIYPNPTQDSFQVQLEMLPKEALLQVVSLSGKMLLKSRVRSLNQTFQTSKFPPGIYQIQFYSGNKLIGSEALIITD